ncbi:DEAD/DEAH box helicase [Paenibacillus campinasensis]|uniref:DEAD/DEAH box helicase n=1 Tax=Paenibacillus campinasensis TaxID=66347 RepID=A0ABW9SZP6_9BACL|nr:DEAD/DEAH box helicase [Paenibacillus campinasensis]MUG66510.1 DEAD/DEAH box helicase [Paenibacillus campinasensis]
MNATNFHTLGIAQDFTERLAEFGIESPSPVQSEAIPHILEGRDVLATSQTGTGKTLAYLLPVLQTIDPEVKGTQKVILAPTQELALQIVREAERYGEPRGIGVLGLIGGAAVKRQIEKLKQHPELVIGTPGRIRELIEVRKLKMHLVKTIVIDEVDQVFQLGAGGDVDRILKSALRDRQLVFLSATVSQQTADLVKQEMDRPVEVGIDPDMKTPSSLEHYYFVSEERDKLDMLRRVVRHYNPERAIVFVNNTDDLGEVEAKLNYLGLNAAAIYGDADKLTRSRVLNAFREGRTRLLVASDVAARGLDIEGLGMVINFDPPLDAEHYTHRAGRTGRMGRSGMVISLITDRQTFIMRKFKRELGITIEERAFYAGKVRAPRTASGSPQRSGGSGSGSGKARQARKPAAVSGKGRASTGKATAERQSERERTRKNKGAPRWLKDKSRE